MFQGAHRAAAEALRGHPGAQEEDGRVPCCGDDNETRLLETKTPRIWGCHGLKGDIMGNNYVYIYIHIT